MAGLKMLEQVQANWGQRVADLWNVAYTPPALRVTRGLTASTGDYAQGGANGINVDRSWLRSASRSDLRSLYVHEATHALGVGAAGYDNPGGHRRFENLADASTYLLAPKDDPGWQPRDAVLRLVERQGLSPVATAPNRPSAGRDPGHKRNTGNQQRSGNNGQLPMQSPATAVLPPGQQSAFAAQLAALQSQYAQRVAALKVAGGGIRADRARAFADIKANRVQGAVAAEADALQRGIVGSSADLGARAGVVADAANAKVDARSMAAQQLAGLRVDQIGANTDFSVGIAGVIADKASAEAELANQRYMEGLIGAQTDTYQSLFQKYLQRLLAKGKNPAGTSPLAGFMPPNYETGNPGWGSTGGTGYIPGGRT